MALQDRNAPATPRPECTRTGRQ